MRACSYANRYIRPPTYFSALYQYPTPIIYPPTLICIIKSRMSTKTAPTSNKHPPYLLHTSPLMRLRGSECREKTRNHELRTRAKLSLSQRSLLVHHFKRASITTPLCLYCLRIPNPFTAHTAHLPSPPVLLNAICFLGRDTLFLG